MSSRFEPQDAKIFAFNFQEQNRGSLDRLSSIVKQRLAAQQVGAETEHPSADTLVAFSEHGLRASASQLVLSHLAICPACRQTVSLAVAADASSVALASSTRSLRFPTALRWAFAAAMLAVAIGVGVLSHEHENRPGFSAAGSHSQTQEESATPAAPSAPRNSEIAKAKAAPDTTTKATRSTRANSEPRVVADASVRRAEPQSKKAQGDVVGGLVAGSPRTLTITRPNVEDGFVASNAAAPLPPRAPVAPADGKASALSEVAAEPPGVVGGVPDASASAQPVLAAGSNAQLEAAGKARKVDNSTFNGPTTANLQQRPGSKAEMKAIASSAIGGPVRTSAARAFSPIAHWTITSNGKLQRRSSDGRFSYIEPAPGVSIRAVAAQGIEVWAAGSQPDLSAKQWQQSPVLFHSSDAGESWIKIEGPWQSPINALSLDAANALTVITPDGFWITLDAGKSWTKKQPE